MRQIAFSIIILFSLTATLTYGQASGISKASITSFEREIRELQQKLKIPGLSLAIVKDQQLIFAKGYGWADIEHKVPATENTLYSIASVTKTFTSIILMRLVEESKVDLMEPISHFDSTLKNDSLKVIHFLTHTSEGKPGLLYRYNGDRFATLDKVIEKATGKTYAEVIDHLILKKAGMQESVAGQDILERDKKYKQLVKLLAKPYTLFGDSEEVLSPYPAKKITTSAGLISNVRDLAKYDIAIDNGILLNKSSLLNAWTPFALSNGTLSPHGKGWFVQNYNGLKLVWHFGQWPTYTALYLKIPEKNLTLIILANSDGVSKPFSLGRGNILTSAFALAFLRKFIKPASQSYDVKWNLDSSAFQNQLKNIEAKFGDSLQDEANSYSMIQKYLTARKLRQRNYVKLESPVLAGLTGTYELLPSPLKFSLDNGKFWLQTSLLTEPVELFAENENKFFIKILDARFEFLKDEAGKVYECVLYLDGNKYRCKKLS